MKALLLVAHGSRRPQSNQEIVRLTRKIEDLPGNTFDIVAHAFLERVTPNVQARMDELVQSGAHEITVFPYFLASGRHVSENIPAILAEISKKHPRITIHLAPHFGALPGIAALIMEQIR
jgi:sirohydrochlorin ferrochelatase